MYKILAIHFSQSGQLTDIINNFLKPLLENQNIKVDHIQYETKKEYPFPWTSDVFFDTMPESVLEIPDQLKEIEYKHDKYDLIILGHQPWFLSPSIPTNSLLKNEKFKTIIKGTNIITLIGSRNMWLNAHESVKNQIEQSGGKLIGNIPLIDDNNNQISALTILHWMLTGNKTRYLGIFPLPGIPQFKIDEMSKYGRILEKSIKNNSIQEIQEQFLNYKKIKVDNGVMFVELRGKRLFEAWAKLIKNKTKSRKLWVNIYKYYLLIALFVIAPIVITLLKVLVFPFLKNYFIKQKEYFFKLK